MERDSKAVVMIVGFSFIWSVSSWLFAGNYVYDALMTVCFCVALCFLYRAAICLYSGDWDRATLLCGVGFHIWFCSLTAGPPIYHVTSQWYIFLLALFPIIMAVAMYIIWVFSAYLRQGLKTMIRGVTVSTVALNAVVITWAELLQRGADRIPYPIFEYLRSII